MPFELQVRGMERVRRAVDRLARQNPQAAQRALLAEAEVEMTEAKKRTPVKTGALRASGRVELLGLSQVGVRWAFGGPAISYAVAQHENLDYFHRVGQAKFLESVLVEAAPHLPARIARRMRELLGTR